MAHSGNGIDSGSESHHDSMHQIIGGEHWEVGGIVFHFENGALEEFEDRREGSYRGVDENNSFLLRHNANQRAGTDHLFQAQNRWRGREPTYTKQSSAAEFLHAQCVHWDSGSVKIQPEGIGFLFVFAGDDHIVEETGDRDENHCSIHMLSVCTETAVIASFVCDVL